MDTSAPAQMPVKPPSALLNGNVSKEEAVMQPGGGTDAPTVGGIFINGVRVGGGTMNGAQLQDAIKRINANHPGLLLRMGGPPATFSGLSGQAQMSTEDYRKMQYGVVGMVSRMTDGPPVVINVYPTCPAAKAGIRTGDMVVKVDDRALRASEGQYIFWKTVAGKADTPVDVTVLRDGKLISFHMIRMNIEDIEDSRIRHNYERMLSLLGPPTGGMDAKTDSTDGSGQ
jgi:PDZ domain